MSPGTTGGACNHNNDVNIGLYDNNKFVRNTKNLSPLRTNNIDYNQMFNKTTVIEGRFIKRHK